MYVAGYVLAVKTAHKQDYIDMAREAWPLFRDNGATRMIECWGEDVPEGKLTSFPMAVKAEPDETVLFSWVEYPDRETHDRAMKAMQEAHTGDMPERMTRIMDPKRMIFGGFEAIVEV